MNVQNRKIFLSGGAGFIGTRIIKRLIKNNQIIVYDTMQRNALKDTDLRNHKNLTLIQGDVLDQARVMESMKGSNMVLHLAAIAGVDTVMQNPIKTMNVNLVGTCNVLEAAATLQSLERFVYFSTSEVFGSRAYNVDESHETSQGSVGEARWTYAVSKLAGEHLGHSYYRENKLPFVTLRPFNVYGPGQVGEGAIHAFTIRALSNEDLVINGDGSQIRSWCYIDDMVDGLMLCLEKPESVGHAFNIGDPKSTVTIYDLAKRIVRLSNTSSGISFQERTYVDIDIRVPNIEKAKTMLGFQPKIDLDEGIKRTIEWYRNRQ